jgi:hypothetical protein
MVLLVGVFLKNAVFWDAASCGSCEIDVNVEISASIRVKRIGELGTMLAVTSNRCHTA